MESITEGAGATQALGEQVGRDLKADFINQRVIALYGDLGSGKTTFTQGLAKSLGVEGRVLSPTFILVREHPLSGVERPKTFYHVDLYRIENPAGLASFGLDEILQDEDSVVVIEWAERAKDILPTPRLEITFERLDEDKRKITIKAVK